MKLASGSQQPLLRYICVITLVLSICLSRSSAQEIGCHVYRDLRIFFHEKYHDCHARVEVPICTGHCESNTIIHLNELMGIAIPMQKQDCRCCSARKSEVAPSRLLFRCRNGDIFRERVWYARALECECLHC